MNGAAPVLSPQPSKLSREVSGKVAVGAVPNNVSVSADCKAAWELASWPASVDAEEVVAEDSVAVAAVWGDARSARSVLKLLLELSAAAFGSPNSVSMFSNWLADWLNCTISLVGAFSRADTTAGEDSTGEFTFESVCSKLATPGLSEETDPICENLHFFLSAEAAIPFSGTFSAFPYGV